MMPEFDPTIMVNDNSNIDNNNNVPPPSPPPNINNNYNNDNNEVQQQQQDVKKKKKKKSSKHDKDKNRDSPHRGASASRERKLVMTIVDEEASNMSSSRYSERESDAASMSVASEVSSLGGRNSNDQFMNEISERTMSRESEGGSRGSEGGRVSFAQQQLQNHNQQQQQQHQKQDGGISLDPSNFYNMGGVPYSTTSQLVASNEMIHGSHKDVQMDFDAVHHGIYHPDGRVNFCQNTSNPVSQELVQRSGAVDIEAAAENNKNNNPDPNTRASILDSSTRSNRKYSVHFSEMRNRPTFRSFLEGLNTESDVDTFEHFEKTWRKLKIWKKQKLAPYWKIKVAQFICVIYILILTFSYPPIGIRDPITKDIIDPNSAENTANGVIYVNGDYRPVVAIGGWQKFCLAMSRMSAFSLYPMMVVVFVSKMKALQTFFVKTPLSMYMGLLNEGHDYHAHAGAYIAFDVWIHTIFHLLRWISQGNGSLLWTTNAGISGLITVVVTPLITFPMMYWKKKLSYEVRKGLHYLFVVFAVAMCFHVPVTAIPNGGFIAPVLGTCIVMYALDWAYVYCYMTEKVETTSFHVLSTGVRISMPVSRRFTSHAQRGLRAGYAYINIPWVDDKQWHPFSLFEDPNNPQIQQMFLMKCGDWTGDVHTALTRDTKRPCWIKGPFPSPYSHAGRYDNQILVASGIGITPALSAINAFKAQRRINLIWAVRDPEMLEFFLKQMYLDHDGWNLIFYTGRKPIKTGYEESNTNIKIIRGRPDLSSVIPNIIFGIESKEGLPENYTATSLEEAKRRVIERCVELDRSGHLSGKEKIVELSNFVESLGFSFTEILEEIKQSNAEKAQTCPEPGDNDALGKSENNAQRVLFHLRTSSNLSANLQRQESCSSTNSTGSNPAEQAAFTASSQWNSIEDTVNRRRSNEVIKPSFKPWEKNESQERCVKRLDNDYIMNTWAMMYCGGSQPVINTLREISIDYHIDLHIDSFAW